MAAGDSLIVADDDDDDVVVDNLDGGVSIKDAEIVVIATVALDDDEGVLAVMVNASTWLLRAIVIQIVMEHAIDSLVVAAMISIGKRCKGI